MSEQAGPELDAWNVEWDNGKRRKVAPFVVVDRTKLSEGEREACAVLVASMRRGWGFSLVPDNDPEERWYVIDDKPETTNWDDHWGRTPSQAYASALKATETEDEQ